MMRKKAQSIKQNQLHKEQRRFY